MTKDEINAKMDAAATRSKLLHQQAEAIRKKSPVKAAQISKEARAEDKRVEDLTVRLSSLRANTLVEFEDNGQDFLRWLVSPSGEVIDCVPMQAHIWIGKKVVRIEGNPPVNTYLVLEGADGEVRLKHGVKSMIRTKVQSLQELEAVA